MKTNPRNISMKVYLTQAQKDLLRIEAAKAGKTLSSYVLNRLQIDKQKESKS